MPQRQSRAARKAPHVRYEMGAGRRRTVSAAAARRLRLTIAITCSTCGVAAAIAPISRLVSTCVFVASHAALVCAVIASMDN